MQTHCLALGPAVARPRYLADFCWQGIELLDELPVPDKTTIEVEGLDGVDGVDGVAGRGRIRPSRHAVELRPPRREVVHFGQVHRVNDA